MLRRYNLLHRTTAATGLGIAFALSTVIHASPLAFTPGPDGVLPGGPPGSVIETVANHRLTRPSIDDIVVGLGVFPPTAPARIPLRLLAPQPDGTVIDLTNAKLGATPPAFTLPRQIVFGDINRDGRADIFVAATGYDKDPFSGETNGLLLSQPDGSFRDASSQLPVSAAYSHSAAIADINGDGNPDIYVGNIYSAGQVPPYLLLGDGGTSMIVSENLPIGVAPLSGATYTASLLLDVDNDGSPDLVLGSGGDSRDESLILFNDGTGDFSKRVAGRLPPGLFGTNTINLSFAAIDINGDGFTDLLVSQTQKVPFYLGGAIQVLVNDQHGGFIDETSTFLPTAVNLTGPWYQFLRVIDLNGDGVPDFYAQGVFGSVPESGSNVFAWVSDGSGHYVPVDGSVINNNNPFMVVFADLNLDGLPDLINIWSDQSGQIHWQTFFNATPKAPPSSTAQVVEYYNASQDHYFMTWVPDEIAKLDAGTTIKGWARTGNSFQTYTTAQFGTSPICRFYIPPVLGDSHFYGRGTAECNATAQKNPSFILEDPAFMQMFLPTLGVCPANTTEVYRVFDNRPDANHRYMTDKTVRDQMVAKGWIAEGDGPNLVVMCAPS